MEDILLEPEQEELFVAIVEAARSVPRKQRTKFLVAQTHEGDSLLHPGFPEREIDIYYGDIEILARADLLAIGFTQQGTPTFDVTPLGFKYYEHLKKRVGGVENQVESTSGVHLTNNQALQNNFKDVPRDSVSAKAVDVEKSFNLKNIRTFLTKGFTHEELRRLCYDNPEFRPVYEQLSPEMGKDRVIDILIEFAERQEFIETLLSATKELNPARYKKHQPY